MKFLKAAKCSANICGVKEWVVEPRHWVIPHTCLQENVFQETVNVHAFTSKAPTGRDPQWLHIQSRRATSQEKPQPVLPRPWSLKVYFPDPGPSGFRWRWMPFLERKISWGTLMGTFEWSGENSKRSKQRAVTTFNSFIANCCPMQFLGPAEKGMKAKGCRPVEFSGEKRNGSKTSGSGHTALFLWRA